MHQLSPWQVMATHAIRYKGEEGIVEVVQTLHRAPEFFPFVHLPSRDILLSRLDIRRDLWVGSSGGFDEARELGEAIEQQTGYPLPVKACNNPFRYKGDIAVKIEKFRLPGLLIERAKAPYTNDVYYRIHFSKGGA